MEKKTTFTKQGSSLPQSPQNMLTPAASHPRAWFFGAVFVILLLLGIGIVVTLQQQKKTMEQAEQGVVQITPTTMPTPTPASPSAYFVFYDDLSPEEKFAVASNFSDPLLNAGFAYPPFYNVQATRATPEEKVATITFNQKGEPVVTATIQPYTQTGSDPAASDTCRKEIANQKRILISCIDQAFEGKDMTYILYLLGENPLEIRVSSPMPKEQAHLIRSIISSATNHLR